MTQWDNTRSEALRRKVALSDMLTSDGWAIIDKWLSEEVDRLRSAYERSGPITEGNIYQNEYRRAQLNMLHTLRDLPAALVRVEQEALDAIKPQEDDNEQGQPDEFGSREWHAHDLDD